MKKLKLGGMTVKEGYTNIDMLQIGHTDIIHDLNKYPYPFKDNIFDEILAEDVLEHLNEIVAPLEELHRICKNNALIKIKVPIYPSEFMFENPTHKLVFTRNTFVWFAENRVDYVTQKRFKIQDRKIYFYHPHNSKFPIKQIGFVYTYLISNFKLIENIYFNLSPFIIKPKFMKITLRVIK